MSFLRNIDVVDLANWLLDISQHSTYRESVQAVGFRILIGDLKFGVKGSASNPNKAKTEINERIDFFLGTSMFLIVCFVDSTTLFILDFAFSVRSCMSIRCTT